ncbi:hypothetical protein BXY82_1801 [Gelidibacter sediminis]|uniref:Uncharacterized protein n=1 Tax=Gelidibacter sediminis TaxID=1608710 RepID=A0A4R7Q011_9FLAO|nr:hypothetical protein [Gelidibacter sediminis]TDU39771.1 hypothetical protein BXY82_1801 [Gelidibacter sediminis]
MIRIIFVLVLSMACVQINFGQELQEGQLRWSEDHKLNLDDFKIKISTDQNEAVFSQFMISHALSGFDFMKRNLNQKIDNIFLGKASWIDTTKVAHLQQQLEFQQLQFDLAEIQSRKFRKQILKDKGKIAKGFDIVNQINNEIMAQFSELRLELIQATDSGRDKEQLNIWKIKIANELANLDEYRFENKKPIKLNE